MGSMPATAQLTSTAYGVGTTAPATAGTIATAGGAVTVVGAPGSGTPFTPSADHDCILYVTGGAVTAVTIGAVSLTTTGGSFYIPKGTAVTLTYTVAPTLNLQAV